MSDEITVVEEFESRRVGYGLNPWAELRYNIFVPEAKDTYHEAYFAMLGALPQIGFDLYGDSSIFLPLTDSTVEPKGHLLWGGVAYYGTLRTDEPAFAFDTGGGTQHITQSRETVGKYAPPGKTAPDFKGAIGVTADSIEGVDVPVPVYQFSETHFKPDQEITDSYKRTVYVLTGCVNSQTFKGFEPGECLFLGVLGTRRGVGPWELNYRFAASPNVTDLKVGDIVGIEARLGLSVGPLRRHRGHRGQGPRQAAAIRLRRARQRLRRSQ